MRARKIPGQPAKFPGAARGEHTQLRGMRGRFIKGGVGFSWTGLEVMIDNTLTRGDAVYEAIVETAQALIPDMVAYGQQNARWQDRTGNARKGLKGTFEANPQQQKVTLFFGHGVFYGVYLELMDFGSYQIVPQTIAWGRQEIFNRTAASQPMGRKLL